MPDPSDSDDTGGPTAPEDERFAVARLGPGRAARRQVYFHDLDRNVLEISALERLGDEMIHNELARQPYSTMRDTSSMAFTNSVTTINLNDMIEFDKDARLVRKKIVQSEIIVSEIVCYEPDQFTKTHVHPHQDEIFYCMQGKGIVTFTERDDIPIEQGSVVFVPSGIEHGVETIGDERLVLVFTKGPGLPNPDRRTISN